MKDEGSVSIDTRRYGLLAGLRKKQWWSFEGLDPQQKLYFVFLALEAFPVSYVSLKLIDYQNGIYWTEDHLGSFQSAPGDRVDVNAAGKWGSVRFAGCAEEGWQVDVQTPQVSARCAQRLQAPAHRNWLLTWHIDYTIQQFASNRCEGTVQLNGRDYPFAGYGYHEHNWGVQPRHSSARWLHFWTPEGAGVALACRYDAGISHAYTFLWQDGREAALAAPAEFSFDPARPEADSQVNSPDLRLCLRPLYGHHTRMQMPPLLAYIDVDYYEQLLEVEGTALVEGKPAAIKGVGKLDFNWNKW